MRGERVEEAVGGHVAPLPGVSDQHADRREQDEMIKRIVLRVPMQIPCAQDLRARDLVELVRRQSGKHFVLHDHRPVKHAAQRRHGRANLLEECAKCGSGTDVAGPTRHCRAKPPDGVEDLDGFRGARSRATGQHEVAGPTLREEPGDLESEPARAPGDQIRGVGGTRSRSPVQSWLGCGGLVVEIEHDLAEVLSLRHVAERILCPADRKDRVGQGANDVAIDQAAHSSHQRLEPGRTDLARQVNRDVGQAVLERSQPDLRVFMDVTLAELEEPTTLAEAFQTLGDRLAGERVEHDVDAFSVGRIENVISEVERAGITHMRHAQLPEDITFEWRAGRCEDVHARLLSKTNGRQADAASARVDQDPLALPHAPDLVKRIPGGEKGRGDGRRLLERESVGKRKHECCRHGQVGAKTSRAHTHHALTGLQTLHPRADRRDDSGKVIAKHASVLRVGRVHPERLHDVAEVETGGMDLDFNLTFSRWVTFDVLQRQMVEDARLARDELCGGFMKRNAWRTTLGMRRAGAQPWHEARVAPIREFRLVATGHQISAESVEFGFGDASGKVDMPHRMAAQFGMHHPGQAGELGLDGVYRAGDIRDSLRPGGRDPERGPGMLARTRVQRLRDEQRLMRNRLLEGAQVAE